MFYDLIIFDCDGTLADTEYLNNLAVCELLAQQGLPQYDMDHAMTHFVGKRFSQIIADIAAETGRTFPQDISQRYVARAKAMIPTHQKPIAGAAELVYASKAHSTICAASNLQRNDVFYSLEIAGLLPYFETEHIFTGLDVENPKPAPDLFLMAAAKLGAAPENTLVIEDSTVGVRAGVAAGMTTYGFTGTHHSPETHAETLKSAGAHEVFNALIHIEEAIGNKKPFSVKNK